MIRFKRQGAIQYPLLDLATAKKYLRVDYDFEDDLICEAIDDCVDWAEEETRIPWFKGEYNMIINLQCADEADFAKIDPYYDFKRMNVESIDSVSGYNIVGEEIALTDGVDYRFNEVTNRLYFPTMKNIASSDIDHLVVNGEMGWTAEELPGNLLNGLKVLVAHHFENRGLDEHVPAEAINSIGHYKRWY